MNIFVLGTGRCGTMSFIEACGHVQNYSTGHESRIKDLGENRLFYPENHIEADNRLSWMLGRLEASFGDRATYIHMKRDRAAVAASYVKRWHNRNSIIYGYRTTILCRPSFEEPNIDIVYDMIDTIETNIEKFLDSKTAKFTFNLETAQLDFERLWNDLNFVGDFESAQLTWSKKVNKSVDRKQDILSKMSRLPHKLKRIAQRTPEFIRHA